jgi:hypothetical protein
MWALWFLAFGIISGGGYLLSKLLDPTVSRRAKVRVTLFLAVLVALATAALIAPPGQ